MDDPLLTDYFQIFRRGCLSMSKMFITNITNACRTLSWTKSCDDNRISNFYFSQVSLYKKKMFFKNSVLLTHLKNESLNRDGGNFFIFILFYSEKQ